jgi:hypothetical protein
VKKARGVLGKRELHDVRRSKIHAAGEEIRRDENGLLALMVRRAWE